MNVQFCVFISVLKLKSVYDKIHIIILNCGEVMKKSKVQNNYVASAGVLLLLGIFPLFMTDKYYNITFSKFMFFMVVSIAMFFICLIVEEPVRTRKAVSRKNEKFNFVLFIKESDKLSLSIILFLISGLFAMIFSPYPFSSLCGYAGRYMGYDFIIAVALLYFYISRYYFINERELYVFELSGILVILLAVIEFLGFDPFRLMLSVGTSKLGTFLSTIGNVNVFASFIALVIPISLYFLCFAPLNKKTIIYCVSSVIGLWGVFASNSDSAYLALFGGLWIIGLMALKKRETSIRFFAVTAAIGIFSFAFGIIHSLFKNAFHLTKVTEIATGKYALIITLISAVFLALFVFCKMNEKVFKVLRITYVSLTVIGAVSVIFAVIYFTLIDKETNLGFLESYLRFNDSWGTERGMIWRMSLDAYAKMPFINKIFGYGEDSVVILLAQYFKTEMLDSGYYTNNTHNEILQYLLTMGIFGVGTYISVIVFALKKCFEKCKEDILFGAIASAIIAYVVQSMVNITQPITTPILFVLISMAACVRQPAQKK